MPFSKNTPGLDITKGRPLPKKFDLEVDSIFNNCTTTTRTEHYYCTKSFTLHD